MNEILSRILILLIIVFISLFFLARPEYIWTFKFGFLFKGAKSSKGALQFIKIGGLFFFPFC